MWIETKSKPKDSNEGYWEKGTGKWIEKYPKGYWEKGTGKWIETKKGEYNGK